MIAAPALPVNPKVTVLMAVHNGERFLEETIASIGTQTFDNFEFVIIDDSSSDRTPMMLEAAAKRDPRLRIQRNERNLRLPACLNRGLILARGQYIARIDADDIASPERLKRQVEFLDANPDHVLVGCSYRSIDEHGRLRYRRPNPMNDRVAQFVTRFRIPMTHPGLCYRRLTPSGELVQYSETYPLAEDFELISRLAAAGKIACLGNTLIDYRFHRESISNVGRSRAHADHAVIAEGNLARHYPGAIVGGLLPMLSALYRADRNGSAWIGAASDALEQAVDFDSGGDPLLRRILRRRAAGVLAEAAVSGQPRGPAALALCRAAPRFAAPLARRVAELRGWLDQEPGPS